MFNGTGYLTQQLDHYILRCGFIINGPPTAKNALLFQLFVQLLEGATFTQYANLSEGSFFSWQGMKQEFLGQYHNTQRCGQRLKIYRNETMENERITDFIAKWRAFTFECLQKFIQHELVRVCSQLQARFLYNTHATNIQEVSDPCLRHMAQKPT